MMLVKVAVVKTLPMMASSDNPIRIVTRLFPHPLSRTKRRTSRADRFVDRHADRHAQLALLGDERSYLEAVTELVGEAG